jgi:hypothetical protein
VHTHRSRRSVLTLTVGCSDPSTLKYKLLNASLAAQALTELQSPLLSLYVATLLMPLEDMKSVWGLHSSYMIVECHLFDIHKLVHLDWLK